MTFEQKVRARAGVLAEMLRPPTSLARDRLIQAAERHMLAAERNALRVDPLPYSVTLEQNAAARCFMEAAGLEGGGRQ